MNKESKYTSRQNKNNNDKFWEIYRYFESMNNKGHSAFQELLDFTMKNNHPNRKKK